MSEIDDNMFGPKLRIVGGRAAKKDTFPFQIAFSAKSPSARNAYVPFCGGVLIGIDKILTAAHCFESDLRKVGTRRYWVPKSSLKGVMARAGGLKTVAFPAGDSLDTGQWRKLDSCRVPDAYTFPIHDIAVVKTTKQFYITTFVTLIPYALRFSDFLGPCYSSGFGKTSWSSQSVQTSVLMFARMDVLTYDQCIKKEKEIGYLQVICAMQVKDIASGDSGGPLICYNTGYLKEKEPLLVGIISGKSSKSQSLLFTRVSSYASFIEDETVTVTNSGHNMLNSQLCILMTLISLSLLHLP